MNIIEFIYALIERYVPITTTRLEQIKSEAKEWYSKEVLNEETPKRGLTLYVRQYGESWYGKTFLALAYLWAVRQVADYMNPNPEQDDEF